MKKLWKRFLSYIIRDRRTPKKNRERAGQNLMITAVIIFFVFIINFVIIIGSDTKFGHKLSTEAKNVYQQTIKVQARRGTIYDRNGIPLAEDSSTYSVFAIISKTYIGAKGEKLYVQTSQFDKVAEILHNKLGIKKKLILKQLAQEGLYQVSFGKLGSGISYSVKTEIEQAMEKANIQGIGFTASPGRLYPNGQFASQFIGLAQLDDKTGTYLVGKTGLEASLNDILAGQDGTIVYQKDKNGNPLLGTGKSSKTAVDGKDVYTTLSEPLQTYLETQMDVFQGKAKGKLAAATVVNAKTGEILATTERPTYNAQTLEGYKDLTSTTSQLYQNQYEPGSTMKVMTLASAIDSKVFKANETYYSNSYQVADAVIKDWDVNEGITSGNYLTMAQGFAHSSNIAMTMLEQKMGEDKWLNYLSKFKFGYPTRFGMLWEGSGLFPSGNEVASAQSSFGQGVAVTQIQMLRAFTAISNDGEMLEPQFVSKIYDPNSKSERIAKTEVVGHPVSKTAAEKTRDYMVTVGTDPYWGTLQTATTGPVIQVGNESVAVKSGTAQIADTEHGGYLEGQNDTINSVVAMVPSDNPDFIMYVTLQQPEHFSLIFWQDVVNPVLERAELLKDDLTTPVVSTTSKTTSYKLPNYIGKRPGTTSLELRNNLVHPIILGTGSKIAKMSKDVGDKLLDGSQLLLLTNKLESMPDMYGWTKANAKKFSEWTGITVKFKGKKSGKIIKQSVESGHVLSKVKKLTLTLGD